MKKIIKIKESELIKLIELSILKEQLQPKPEHNEPDIETIDPEVEPDIEIDRPITPEKEPWEDPFTPRRIQPGSEPQPRARFREKR